MLRSLTSLRFFAALAVFMMHNIMLLLMFPRLVKVIQYGYLGVPFFFVLSGFIITYNYLNKFSTLDVNKVRSYYVARLARIYPVHLLAFLVAAYFIFRWEPISGNQLGIQLLMNLTLLQSWSPDPHVYFSFNGASWSLCVEMFFYIIAPFVLWAIARTKLRLSKATLWTMVLFVFILIPILWTIRDTLHPDMYRNNVQYWLLGVNPIANLPDFVLGIFLCLVYKRLAQELNDSRAQTIMFTIMEIGSIVLLWVVYRYLVLKSFPADLYFVPVLALMIFVFAFEKGVISHTLSNKVSVFLGEISFSLYMFHQLVLNYLGKSPYLEQHHLRDFVLEFIITIIVSSLIFLFYEKPSRNFIRHSLPGLFQRATRRIVSKEKAA